MGLALPILSLGIRYLLSLLLFLAFQDLLAVPQFVMVYVEECALQAMIFLLVKK